MKADFTAEYVWCVPCLKRRYLSKRGARRARSQVDRAMHIYPCPVGDPAGYHLGHTAPGTPRAVMRARHEEMAA